MGAKQSSTSGGAKLISSNKIHFFSIRARTNTPGCHLKFRVPFSIVGMIEPIKESTVVFPLKLILSYCFPKIEQARITPAVFPIQNKKNKNK